MLHNSKNFKKFPSLAHQNPHAIPDQLDHLVERFSADKVIVRILEDDVHRGGIAHVRRRDALGERVQRVDVVVAYRIVKRIIKLVLVENFIQSIRSYDTFVS